jgi:hypothetical protein
MIKKTSKEEYNRVLGQLSSEFPEVKLIKKSDSSFMKFLSVLLFFNKTFMDDYTTTIWNYIWLPKWWDDENEYLSKAIVLRHEMVHLRQQKRYGFVLYCLVYLLFPLPILLAWGRAVLEKEAYEEDIKAAFEYYGASELDNAFKSYIVENFTGSDYGWMWPFRASIEKWYEKVVYEVVNGK